MLIQLGSDTVANVHDGAAEDCEGNDAEDGEENERMDETQR